MPIRGYGVWKINSFTWDNTNARDKTDTSPHGYVKFVDPDEGPCNSAVNVKSSDAEISSVVHWENGNFAKDHPVIKALQKLDDPGFYPVEAGGPRSDLRLDFHRSKVLKITDGKILPTLGDGPDDDLVDQLDQIMAEAVSKGATLYIFGQKYTERRPPKFELGIHQVHQNQGNFWITDRGPRVKSQTGQWFRENGVGQDGALFFHFPEDDTWKAVFLAFASQAAKTDDDTGRPSEGSGNYFHVLERGPILTPDDDDDSKDATEPVDVWPSESGPETGTVRIAAALINPVGPGDEQEQVRILNQGSEPVDVEGWYVQISPTVFKKLPSRVIAPGVSSEVAVRPECWLPNKRATTIYLRNKDKLVVDSMGYTGNQVREGIWVQNS